MGYTALLFCPEEKTARTVTQVLSELEFTVEACTEPFAAVKKLMAQHFDAIVVDCENEQNATLLFKSARNSTSNQFSLAVAVVEGQAGVAKAFRIGANLVLTKPINIEQAKGTLRVARGLLRKAEPGKPGVPAAGAPAGAPAAAPPASAKSAPAPLKPISSVRPTAPPPVAAPKPVEVRVVKPVAPPAWPAAAAASSAPVQKDPDPLEISIEEPASAPLASAPAAAQIQQAAPQARVSLAPTPASTAGGSGAASAPAPARKAPEPLVTEQPRDKATETPFEKPAAAEASAAIVGSAPSFTFGGATSEPEWEGGKKKLFIGIAAAVVLVGGIIGYTQFKGHSSAAATTTVATAPAPVSTQPAKPSAQPSVPAANSVAPVQVPAASADDDTESAPQDITLHSSPATTKASKAAAAAPSKNVASEEEEEPAPLVVKGGKVAGHASKAAPAEVAAPSLAGMAPGTTPPPNFVPTTSNAFKPVLQTLNISQGVSQGLLLKKVSPSYPPNALRMRIEGTVEFLATVSKDGSITRIKVVSGDSQLTKSASDGVKDWNKKPFLLNGEPVEIQTQITVNFKLPR